METKQKRFIRPDEKDNGSMPIKLEDEECPRMNDKSVQNITLEDKISQEERCIK